MTIRYVLCPDCEKPILIGPKAWAALTEDASMEHGFFEVDCHECDTDHTFAFGDEVEKEVE